MQPDSERTSQRCTNGISKKLLFGVVVCLLRRGAAFSVQYRSSISNPLRITPVGSHTYRIVHKALSARRAVVGIDIDDRNKQVINGQVEHQSRLLTPYQILHEATFSPTKSGIDRKVPLHECLRLMKEALERIAIGEVDIRTILDDEPTVIRLEHFVSNPIDPLRWLHAQTRGKRHPKQKKEPTIYFANAEYSLETAVFGSAYSHKGAANETLWNLISELPDRSRIYGGERFDKHSPRATDEWKAFGNGLWILPAVELRTVPDLRNYSNYVVSRDSDLNYNLHNGAQETSIAVHLYPGDKRTWKETAQEMLMVLSKLSDSVSDSVPTTTLPPIISRDYSYGPDLDGQEVFERGVTKALDAFENNEGFQKVVLARRMELTFGSYAQLSGLDIIRRWKFGGHEGGHLLYLFPGSDNEEDAVQKEFFGCSPERLFQIEDGLVSSEALAGSRPRGSTQEADAQLLEDLFTSPKDREENLITGRFVKSAFRELQHKGLLKDKPISCDTDEACEFFVRRLRHIQHICQRMEGQLTDTARVVDVSRSLLQSLHPTPAINGFPSNTAFQFLRDNEAVGFDRGYFAGPFGSFGRESADIVVAIRSGLLSKTTSLGGDSSIKASLFAGAGIVPGSTVQGEWGETSYKLGVVSSLFTQSPITMKSAPTANVAWATAFVEELVRCGVTQFYVCPGSRSTPLVAAVSKVVRSNVGIVHALSVHDERGAGFRAVGYGRGTNRPAVVITSSGTATGNLYPAIMEAGMDGVPLIVLTADRPYESRDTGANQAIDQVKVYSSTYCRWFRDILPPSDDVPVSLALSDANQAVDLSRKLKGPVHVNIQFRENLAPDAGPIRSDNRVDSKTTFNGLRFTDVPGFHRWSLGGGRWLKSYSTDSSLSANLDAASELADMISKSKRGLIVVGNVRSTIEDDESEVADVISTFAQTIGFPIMAGVQSGSLRFRSPAVIPFSEHLLKHPTISSNLKPDLIIQIGFPLISTEIPNMIQNSMKSKGGQDDTAAGLRHHVLIHPHHPSERADASLTVSHKISAEVTPFLKSVTGQLQELALTEYQLSSDLAPLVSFGRRLSEKMPEIIHDSSSDIVSELRKKCTDQPDDDVCVPYEESDNIGDTKQIPMLTEPQVILALTEYMAKDTIPMSLFLSNSMPIRDAEFFLYPKTFEKDIQQENSSGTRLCNVGVNRGASGIDGIISTAAGFAEATQRPTTLIVGDVAALHDINALHTLSNSKSPTNSSPRQTPSLTTIVINNDGGGIFSFLPVAKHGNDVSFDEFFGTPTNSFSFQKGVEASGLTAKQSSSFESLKETYQEALRSGQPCVIEAKVAGREANVAVHKEITKRTNAFLGAELDRDILSTETKISMKSYLKDETGKADNDDDIILRGLGSRDQKQKIILLLHGWMGDKTEWDAVGKSLAETIPSGWTIVSIDLPGHGEAPHGTSSELQKVQSALGLSSKNEKAYSIDEMAFSILRSLSEDYDVYNIDAIAGYSLGGRVALSMKRQSMDSENIDAFAPLINDATKLILLGSYPGDLLSASLEITKEIPGVQTDAMVARMANDDALSRNIKAISSRASLFPATSSEESLMWSKFLRTWYKSSSLWGSLERDQSHRYRQMLSKRTSSLALRGYDIAAVLRQSSPSRHSTVDWQSVEPTKTLFVAGSQDVKYSELGRTWAKRVDGITYAEVPNAGHGLLVQAPDTVADIIENFLIKEVAPSQAQSASKRIVSISSQEGAQSRKATKTSSKETAPKRISNDATLSKHSTPERARGNPSTEVTPVLGNIGSLDFEMFEIDLRNEGEKYRGVLGIGWGNEARSSTRMEKRSGFILNLLSEDGLSVGIGEVSPLTGLHPETLKEAETQLITIKKSLERLGPDRVPEFNAVKLLSMDGSLADYMKILMDVLGVHGVVLSVRSGMEMVLLSLASQIVRMPVLQAITEYAAVPTLAAQSTLLPLNGIIMRDLVTTQSEQSAIMYPSLKVKVGHRSAVADALAIVNALQQIENNEKGGRIRADANRAWSMDEGEQFIDAINRLNANATAKFEFIEEPLRTQQNGEEDWSFARHLHEIEQVWYKRTGIPYALDESVADLAAKHLYEFDSMEEEIRSVFSADGGSGGLVVEGCAALVLKPALLGFETSMRLARMAHTELGIGAVFSSSFDSGVGLAYTAFLGAASDMLPQASNGGKKSKYAHGAGTFSMLSRDTLSPSFASYVTDQGMLKVSSLSRALYGLGLDEMMESFVTNVLPEDEMSVLEVVSPQETAEYQSSAATSSSGRKVSVVVSLPLPFSDEVASSRFTDLPQQSRWSPWLKSVAYLDGGRETEWTLNVRGVTFSWRAVSTIIDQPFKGISWESVSGLKNIGVVEFIPISEDACFMKVRMTILTPRVLAALFRGTSVFIEDFLQNKILKWSLEMFRDTIKGDLALERGDVELGDALFGAVEGRANAIEATLSSSYSGGDAENQS